MAQVAVSRILGMDSGMAILFLIVDAALALYTGRLAMRKGYSYYVFMFASLFFPIIMLVVVSLIPDKSAVEQTNTTNKDIAAAEALIQYKKLLDDGVLTEKEFAEKKKELLG